MGRISTKSGGILALVLLAVGRLSASPVDLRPEVGRMAEQIAKELAKHALREIAVGEFTGPANWQVGGGRGIAELLAQELKQHGLTVKAPPCEVAVKGEYEANQDEDTRQLTAKISAVVRQRSGKVLLTFDQPIDDPVKNAALLGVDVQFPRAKPEQGKIPTLDEKAQAEAVRKAMNQPTVHIKDGIVRAAADSPYAVEFLVAPRSKAKYEPRKAQKPDTDFAFVEMHKGEVYAVKLINDSAYPAAVTLTIDGLSMFVFSEMKHAETGRPRYSQVIVPAGQSVLILGWHQTNRKSKEFLVVDFPQGAAAALQSPGRVGVITASFAAAWEDATHRPPDEPAAPKGKATAAGTPVDAEYSEVDFKTGVIRATVNVRYDR